jgi:cation diffusion facilitator family transporter
LDKPLAREDVARNAVSNTSPAIKNSSTVDFDSDNALLKKGFTEGQRIAKLSVITLVSIGIAELVMGQISGSIVATADGIDSISDAMISLVVFLGLRFAMRPADKKFHFGYYKVESFAALMAAIGMVAVGIFIIMQSYQSLLNPHEIHHPFWTMIVLASAGAISLHRAFQMRKIAHKYNLLSLKTDAKNSIKDGSASIIGFLSVLIATQFGFIQMDAIGGLIIAGYIFSVAYLSIRQSSLILVDSWHNPTVTDRIRHMIEDRIRIDQPEIKVRSVLLRPAGITAQGEIHIDIDGNNKLADVEILSLKIQMLIRSKFPNIQRVTVIPHAISSSKK